MNWRTISIFVEPGKDISVVTSGEFSKWEMEAIVMRVLEKIQDEEIHTTHDEPELGAAEDEQPDESNIEEPPAD